MIQSAFLKNDIVPNAEFSIICDSNHIKHVWDVMLPELKRSMLNYISRIEALGGARVFFNKLIHDYEKKQSAYNSFFSTGWYITEKKYKEFKRHVRMHCPVFSDALKSKTRVLNEWKANFNSVNPEKLFNVLKNIYDFNIRFETEMTEKRIAQTNCWKDNGLLALVDCGCYLNKVVGPGVESAILYHLNSRVFPGVYKYGLFSLYFLSGRGPIEMPSETSEFIMVKDTVKSRTGIIESDHNYFFPYQVYAYYSLMIFWLLNDNIQKNYYIKFPYKWRYVLTSDFFCMIVDKNRDMLQTLMGNDDILKYEVLEYY